MAFESHLPLTPIRVCLFTAPTSAMPKAGIRGSVKLSLDTILPLRKKSMGLPSSIPRLVLLELIMAQCSSLWKCPRQPRHSLRVLSNTTLQAAVTNISLQLKLQVFAILVMRALGLAPSILDSPALRIVILCFNSNF